MDARRRAVPVTPVVTVTDPDTTQAGKSADEELDRSDNRARVVLVLDPSLGHRAPIDAAARLARDAGAQLSAMVIRNPDYDALAALPFTRELRLSSSLWSHLQPHDVLGDFAGQLQRVERLLGEVAARFGIPYEIVQRHSRFQAAAEAASRLQELTVLDRPPRVPMNPRRRYQQVLSVYAGNERAVRIGSRLATDLRVLHQVLVVAASADTLGALRDKARQLVPGTSALRHYLVVSEDPVQSRGQVAMALNRHIGATQSLVVLPADSMLCPSIRSLSELTAATIVLAR